LPLTRVVSGVQGAAPGCPLSSCRNIGKTGEFT
jgi:hypothetical protein